MADSYTKLFRSLATSTVVDLPLSARWLWVVLLSQADRTGQVHGSIPGLARLANLSIGEVEDGLRMFLSPDPYSRKKTEEGRRVREIDGGWELINFTKYAAYRDEASRSEYKKNWDRANRPSGSTRAVQQSDSSPTSPTSPTNPTNPTNPTGPTPPALSPAPTEGDNRKNSSPNGDRGEPAFDRFWAVYPNRKGKAKALASWRRQKLDAIAEAIVGDVQARSKKDRQWLDGYVPHGSSYVTGRGWEDDIDESAPRASGDQRKSQSTTGRDAPFLPSLDGSGRRP